MLPVADTLESGQLLDCGQLFIACLITSISGLLFGLFLKSEAANSLTKSISRRTVNENIWLDVLDFDHGCDIIATTKNGDSYVGALKYLSDDQSWITLTKYLHYDSANNIEYEYDGLPAESQLMIRVEDIKDCRIVYDKDSVKGRQIADRRN